MSDLVQIDSALEAPISSREALIAYFEGGAKPRADWRIGTEYEKVGVDRKTGHAARYSGPRGIEAILRRLADRYGWTPRFEGAHVVALDGEGASITLEPGGQLELSGRACDSVHCAHDELTQHVNEIVEAGEAFGIWFLGLGIQPLSRVEEIEWVPKRRYAIMAPYMTKVGRYGHRMMKQTATVQTNIDFSSERDAMSKMRVAMGIAPILTALFANSPVSDGARNGYMSFRQHIWTDTDRQRSGLLPFVFSRTAGFEDYVEWALDVPMYFIRRENQFVDLSGMPFRAYLERGAAGQRATLADWQLHLTTLFPEARLKTYIELRSVDSQPPDRMLALPALTKGVFYEDDCLEAAWDLVKGWSWNERLDAWLDAQKEALDARVRGIRLLDLARELTEIARAGLRRHDVRNARGEDETVYLRSLDPIFESGKSPARMIAERWETAWSGNVESLIEFAAYRGD